MAKFNLTAVHDHLLRWILYQNGKIIDRGRR